MSLQLAAQHLASKGRGPDNTLVHMSRNEVKSLSDLAMAHGGHLTINPNTGLPEAGFLSAILPMVAGAALTGLSGGAINPLTAGMIVGGGSYLLNPKAGLMGGLMAGLGAYGGAGLGQGLSGLATSEAGTTTANAATEAAAKAEAEAAATRTAAIQQQAAQNAATPFTNAAQVEQATANAIKPLTPDQIQPIRDNAMMESMASAPKAPTGIDAMYQGAKSIVTDPTADKFKALGGGSYSGLAQTVGSAAAPVASQGLTPNGLTMPTPTNQKQTVPHYKFTPGMATPAPVASPTGVENTYFPSSSYTALSSNDASKLYPGYTSAANGGLMGMATGGISDAHYNLGGYSDGGRLLRGPGDGVSDSIPAMIGKKQPARLADGEFVVPARIVSELGNGSTEAGARRLYAMMDRIQSARSKTMGKGKVAKNTRSDKYLPA